jgi:hypothetical protein
MNKQQSDPFESVREYARERGLSVPRRTHVRIPVVLIRILGAIVIAAIGGYLWHRFGIPHG